MNSGARLAGFGLVLAIALGGGLGIGAAVGPLGPGVRTVQTPPGDTGGHGTEAPATDEEDHGMEGPAQSAPPMHDDLGLTPGPWRVLADTVPAGAESKVVSGVDVRVTGDYMPATPTEPSGTAVLDGYTVALDGAPTLAFSSTFPTPGRYRLLLDVQVAGQVHTAPFTVEVTR